MKQKPIIFNEEQNQIILGSMLGDGCIIKTIKGNYEGYIYREAHSLKQKEYLLWKNKILNFNIHESKIKDYKIISIDKNNITFEYYRKLFYLKGNKLITLNILNKLNLLGLCVWYLDDGCYHYESGISEIVICKKSLENINVLLNFFVNNFNLYPKIYDRKNVYRIVFNSKETKKLCELIEPYVIEQMSYKIGKDYKKSKIFKLKTNKVKNLYWHKNKNKYNQIKRKKYNPQNEKIRKYNYYQKNRERILKRQREIYYLRHEESKKKKRDYLRDYVKIPENKERIRKRNRDYKRKKLKIPEKKWRIITCRCSNCGKESEYTDKELEEVFPYSREKLDCKVCGHKLSVCSGFMSKIII